MQSSLDLTPEQMDRVYAALYEFSFNQLTGSVKQKFDNVSDEMQWSLEQKVKVLEPLLTETQLANYRQQQALQIKLVKDIAEQDGNARPVQNSQHIENLKLPGRR